MKGPFPSYSEALKHAAEGESVMTRNERYAPYAAWCVMTDHEVNVEYAKGWFQTWTVWETIKAAA